MFVTLRRLGLVEKVNFVFLYFFFLYCCIFFFFFVFLYFCIFVFLYFCILYFVFLYFCILYFVFCILYFIFYFLFFVYLPLFLLTHFHPGFECETLRNGYWYCCIACSTFGFFFFFFFRIFFCIFVFCIVLSYLPKLHRNFIFLLFLEENHVAIGKNSPLQMASCLRKGRLKEK